MSQSIRPAHAVIVIEVLKEKFPWLGTEDEVSGADVVDGLNDLIETLGSIPQRIPRAGTKAGGVRPGSGAPCIPVDVEAIVKLRAERVPWHQIADKFGISVRTAQRAVKRTTTV